jgi:hypothetical protein
VYSNLSNPMFVSFNLSLKQFFTFQRVGSKTGQGTRMEKETSKSENNNLKFNPKLKRLSDKIFSFLFIYKHDSVINFISHTMMYKNFLNMTLLQDF